MRVVHLPTEISSQIGILCSGLRKAGVVVNGYNWFHSFLDYDHGAVRTDAFELIKLLDPLLKYCDVFHFHNGNTIMDDFAELSLIAKAGKKMIMHHWGNDVRTKWRNATLNPYDLPDNYMSDQEIHHRLVQQSRYIQHAIVQDVELLPHVRDYYEKVHVVPLAYPVKEIVPLYPKVGNRPVRVVHAPTNRSFKGSDVIERVIFELKQHYPIEWILVENKSHREAREIYAQADLIIDQILCGTYGMFSVEAMSLGKPVVSYIREDVRESLSDHLPIINANPDNIHEVLSQLLQAPEQLTEIGRQSRAYVESQHDVDKIVRQLISIYREL